MRRFLARRDGATAIIVALSGAVIFGFAALAVDVGYVYFRTRELQGAADLAALTAARNPARAQELAEETLRANNLAEGVRIETEVGVYTPDPALAPGARFAAGEASPSAVRVRLHAQAELFFGKIFVPSGSVAISRAATAAQTRFAAFEIGSRLLALRGGVANALLEGLTGSSISLSVMDYNALAQADIDLLSYVEALRTRLDLRAASFDETLNTRIESADAVEAAADVLEARGDPASAAMRRIARAARPLGQVQGLGELIDLGPYSAQDASPAAASARIGVNAFDLATAVLEIANGERQVQLDLGAGVPGLADVQIRLAIGERPNRSPWITVTDNDEVIVRTAQTRLFIDARLASGAAALGQVRVPIFIEAASAQARLAEVSCGAAPAGARVTLSVAPSVGAIALADFDLRGFDNFRRPLALRPAEIVRTPIVRATGFARIDIGGEDWRRVTFTGADIFAGRTKTVSTRDIAQTSISTLLGQTEIDVRALGAGLGLGALTRALAPILARAGAPLDALINSLSDLLGVHLGEADVRVNGVRCDGTSLVG